MSPGFQSFPLRCAWQQQDSDANDTLQHGTLAVRGLHGRTPKSARVQRNESPDTAPEVHKGFAEEGTFEDVRWAVGSRTREGG